MEENAHFETVPAAAIGVRAEEFVVEDGRADVHDMRGGVMHREVFKGESADLAPHQSAEGLEGLGKGTGVGDVGSVSTGEAEVLQPNGDLGRGVGGCMGGWLGGGMGVGHGECIGCLSENRWSGWLFYLYARLTPQKLQGC